MNFVTGPDSAQAWITAHPRATGVVLTRQQGWRLGVDILGRILDD
jgi:hypothetical protein